MLGRIEDRHRETLAGETKFPSDVVERYERLATHLRQQAPGHGLMQQRK
jgi:hypothetical protein